MWLVFTIFITGTVTSHFLLQFDYHQVTVVSLDASFQNLRRIMHNLFASVICNVNLRVRELFNYVFVIYVALC